MRLYFLVLLLNLMAVLTNLVTVGGITDDKTPHTWCTMKSTEPCDMADERFGVGNTTEIFTNNSATRCVESSDPYSFSFTKRDGDKLHLNFQGGGVCWNQETYDDLRCRRYSATPKRDGILDTADKRSPFANYSVVVIHYCSSDYFFGNGTASNMKDSTNQTIYYTGIANTVAVLEYVASQQLKGSFLAETLDKLLISGTSVGAIAAPIWLEQVKRYIAAHSYVVLSDSLVINMPEIYQPYFFNIWGFCGSALMPYEYAGDCLTRNFSHIDLQLLVMRNNPSVVFITVTSKYDNIATASYNRFLEDRGETALWPVEFYDVVLPVLERLNEESNFIVYVVSSFNHLFMSRSRYFDATEFGDTANLDAPVNGTALFSWLADLAGILPTLSQVEAGDANPLSIRSRCHPEFENECGTTLLPKTASFTSSKTTFPSHVPSGEPTTSIPSFSPVSEPSSLPSIHPTYPPSTMPTAVPSYSITSCPTVSPSAVPSTLPTVAPSQCPSQVPSDSPSTKPSILPSTLPTNHPSHGPTYVPSNAPYSKPSPIPSSDPSSDPSIAPSIFPSIAPSSDPSRDPSSDPSSDPSCDPSSCPTSNPSYNPSSIPSLIPSRKPSGKPSETPSSIPMSSPSSTPSAPPSSFPTEVPQSSPTTRPSMVPSFTPSQSPSILSSSWPTSQPLSEPTSIPSLVPSITPSSMPAAIPSTIPLSCPSGIPSEIPTDSPTSTEVPTSTPFLDYAIPNEGFRMRRISYKSSSKSVGTDGYKEWVSFLNIELTQLLFSHIPSRLILSHSNINHNYRAECIRSRAQQDIIDRIVEDLLSFSRIVGDNSFTPFICNGTEWKVGHCALNPPTLCVNCSNPCTSEHLNNTMINFGSDPYFDDFSIDFTSNIATPTVSSMSVLSSAPDSITVQIKFSTVNGFIKCLALDSESRNEYDLVSRFRFEKQLDPVTIDILNITFRNLVPSTSHNIHCSTFSFLGDMSNDMSQLLGVLTPCCRKLSVSLQSTTYWEVFDYLHVIHLNVGLPIPESLEVNVTVLCSSKLLSTSSASTSPVAVVNRIIHFSNLSFYHEKKIALSSLTKGFCFVDVLLSGHSAGLFEVTYPLGRTFEVLASTHYRNTPVLENVTFSPDGSSLELTFNVDTDQAGHGYHVDDCTQLVQVRGLSSESTCWWKSSRCLTVFLSDNGFGVARVGDTLQLKGGVLKAKCLSSFNCETRSLNEEAIVPISKPVLLDHPEVSIYGSNVLGPCDDLVLDASTSHGSGRRVWDTVKWSVRAVHANTSEILLLLNAVSDISTPVTIPSDMLESGELYHFILELCNFLGSCSAGTLTVVIGFVEAVPVVRLHSSQEVKVFRHLPFSVSADAGFQTCGDIKRFSDLELTWVMYELSGGDYELSTAAFTSSVDPTVYLLPPFVLDVGRVYKVVLKAQHSRTRKYSSTSMFISVSPGAVMARLNVSRNLGIRVSDNTVIDASGSYDEDLRGVWGENADLEFSSECHVLFPVGDVCLLSVVSLPGAKFVLSVPNENMSFVGNTFEFTVHVKSRVKSSQSAAIVIVTVLPPLAAVVSISTSRQGLLVNPTKKLMISSTIGHTLGGEAVWSVDRDHANLALSSLSPTVNILSSITNDTIQMTQFPLLLSRNTLSEGGKYVFTLTVTLKSGLLSMGALVIEVNSPPIAGSFDVVPRSGLAINTSFLCTASSWSDENLPLTYEFAAYSSMLAGYSVFRSRRQLPSVHATLVGGQPFLLYQYFVRVQVFDALDGHNFAFAPVQVTESAAAVGDFSAVAHLLTGNNMSTASLKLATHLVAGIINTVNCSGAGNCTTLHRSSCGLKAHNCGFCLPGFYGEDKPSNSLCLRKVDDDDGQLRDTMHIENSPCSTNSDCNRYLLEECRSDSYCGGPMKSCEQNCSGRGTCNIVSHINSEHEVARGLDECFVLDDHCDAQCDCNDGFGGEFCEYTKSVMDKVLSVRQLLLLSLRDLIRTENVSFDTVISWLDGLASVAATSTQLTEQSKALLTTLAVDVLHYCKQLEIPFDDISTSITKILELTLIPSPSPSLDSALDLYKMVGSYMSRDILRGQRPSSIVRPRFRMSALRVDVVEESISLPLGSSTFEFLSALPTHVVTIPVESIGTSVSVLIMSSISSVYSMNFSMTNFLSIPLDIVIERPDVQNKSESSLQFKFQVILAHMKGILRFDNETQQYMTVCVEGNSSRHNYACRDGSNMTVFCNGTMQGTVVSYCPRRIYFPSCVVSASDAQCEVVSFTDESTTCECRSRASTSAQLTVASDSNITAATSRFFPAQLHTKNDNFVSNAPPYLNIVILLVSILLTSIIVSSVLSPITGIGSIVPDECSYKSMLDRGVPRIFSSESLYRRIFLEFMNNHRYGSLLSKDSCTSSSLKWRLMCALSQVSFMCVVVTMLFNKDMKIRSTCVERTDVECSVTRPFYVGQCNWESKDSNSHCIQRQLSDDPMIICFYVLFLGGTCTPLFILLDKALWYIWHCYDTSDCCETVANIKMDGTALLNEHGEFQDKVRQSIQELSGSDQYFFLDSWGMLKNDFDDSHSFEVLRTLDAVSRQEVDIMHLRSVDEQQCRLINLLLMDCLNGVDASIMTNKDLRDRNNIFGGRITTGTLPFIYIGRAVVIGVDALFVGYTMRFALKAAESELQGWVLIFVLWTVLEVFINNSVSTLSANVLLPLYSLQAIVMRKAVACYILDRAANHCPDSRRNVAGSVLLSVRVASRLPNIGTGIKGVCAVLSQLQTRYPRGTLNDLVDFSVCAGTNQQSELTTPFRMAQAVANLDSLSFDLLVAASLSIFWTGAIFLMMINPLMTLIACTSFMIVLIVFMLIGVHNVASSNPDCYYEKVIGSSDNCNVSDGVENDLDTVEMDQDVMGEIALQFVNDICDDSGRSCVLGHDSASDLSMSLIIPKDSMEDGCNVRYNVDHTAEGDGDAISSNQEYYL